MSPIHSESTTSTENPVAPPHRLPVAPPHNGPTGHRNAPAQAALPLVGHCNALNQAAPVQAGPPLRGNAVGDGLQRYGFRKKDGTVILRIPRYYIIYSNFIRCD